MRTLLFAAAVGLFAGDMALAAPSAADHAKNAVSAPIEAKTGRTLYICEDTTAVRRAFVRQFGEIEFVSADSALSGDEAWAAPKCITGSEARRLRQKLASAR